MSVTIAGDTDLLMHNGQLANPLNKWSKALKEITGRRKKTDDDLEEIARIEWLGGLYTDPAGTVAIPADNILAGIIDGARKSRNGKKVEAGVFCSKPYFPLLFKGPKDVQALSQDAAFADYRSVAVNGKRIMRSRPRFTDWRLKFEVVFNPSLVNQRDVMAAVEACGEQCGIGDFRPRYGRFHIEA